MEPAGPRAGSKERRSGSERRPHRRVAAGEESAFPTRAAAQGSPGSGCNSPGGQATGEAPGRPGGYGRRPDREGRDDRPRHAGRPASPDSAGAVRPPPSPPAGDAGRYPHPDKNRRQKPASRDMPRVHSAPARQERTEPDPDSPFAKLLALRSILEGQGDKRS